MLALAALCFTGFDYNKYITHTRNRTHRVVINCRKLLCLQRAVSGIEVSISRSFDFIFRFIQPKLETIGYDECARQGFFYLKISNTI